MDNLQKNIMKGYNVLQFLIYAPLTFFILKSALLLYCYLLWFATFLMSFGKKPFIYERNQKLFRWNPDFRMHWDEFDVD